MKAFLILFFLVIAHPVLAQEQLNFGVNTDFLSAGFEKLYTNPPPDIRAVTETYHVQFFRIPGGLTGRTYFWDKPALMPQAMKLYSDFLAGGAAEGEGRPAAMAEKHAGHAERLSQSITEKVSDSHYENGLKFCKANHLTPIIQLGVWSFHDDNKAYRLVNKEDQVDESHWDVILGNIRRQVEFTHRYFDVVYWEIGNEETHIYSGTTYARIASKYAQVVKETSPGDKVIIQWGHPEAGKIPETWNDDVIRYLEKDRTIDKIDFVAPHYYRGYLDEVHDNDREISKFVRKISMYKFARESSNALKSHPRIKAFYTEFAVFRKNTATKGGGKGDVNSIYNSQLHGLMMCIYLMQFNAGPDVAGILEHGFENFFDEQTFKPLFMGNRLFGLYNETPPETKVVKVFFDHNDRKAKSYTLKDDYCYTVTDAGDKTVLNLVNFTSKPVSIRLDDLIGRPVSVGASGVSYAFDDLGSRHWEASAESLPSASNLRVAAHCYSIINVPK